MPVAQSDNIVEGIEELDLSGLIAEVGGENSNSNELPAITNAAIDELEQQKAAVPAPRPTKPIVGIIYPPPEVRNIVDKTASFVARNGPEFEVRIRQNEQNNPKFNFLNKEDPYHAYYQHKVKEIQEGKTSSAKEGAAAITDALKSSQHLIDEAKKKKQAELLKQVELPFVPKDPPTEFEFVADPPSISAHDLDIVKLTALFVARNGRQFLSTLMNREQRNYQFDFLRPQHSLFQYFTKLLDQYTKVLIPPKDVIKKLGNEDTKKILEDVKYRSNWIRHQEVERRKLEEAAEKERMAYACIDWHDFVVVETVDYQPFEQGHFPPPTTPQEVGARVLLQDRILQGQNVKGKEREDEHMQAAGDDIIQVQDMEEESESSSDEDEEENEKLNNEVSAQQKQLSATFEPPKEDQVIIKKDYDPKKAQPQEKVLRSAAGPKPEEYTISPITGERIPVSKLQEHMRIGLLDPRWKDQRDRQMMEKVNQESVFAPGLAIETQLKQLAERRSDIFGVGGEERPIGKKVDEEEEKVEPPLPWDSSGGMSNSGVIAAVASDENKSDDNKKETIGPSMGNVPQQSGVSHQQTHGILQAPPVHAAMPLPGIVRPIQQQPGPPPGMMMMMNRVGIPPLMGMHAQQQHQFASFPPQQPPQHRPPLLTSAPPVMPPQMQHQPPPPMQIPQAAPIMSTSADDEGPSAKKAKTLEDNLVPEAVFLATNKSPVQFIVACPSMPEKPELNLSGQIITLTLPLTDNVSILKSKIQEVIGLAPSKQKLRLTEGLFFKDSNSLAYYNIGEAATVYLSIKERGGRKK